ncbi:MAG TPA: ROK family protein [Bryobacteraceae bacterium]|jgi:glucokinase|nr:ROK family protein [Bryobacteraceae bacterium]
MAKIVGVLAADRIVAGVVEANRLAGQVHTYPQAGSTSEELLGTPAEGIADLIRNEIDQLTHGTPADVVGIGFAGVIRDGRIEESPNLQQVKGFPLQEYLSSSYARVLVVNDADAMAAGIAATRGKLESLVRVWTIGNGIGYGRYPQAEGVWEGGHMVVSLDPKEKYCGCGGVGHLEGIMGHVAMRRRFLDMEPDEVFAEAKTGDARCVAFVKLWHRALAAATATSVHLDGPGKFYLTGHNARFIDVERLNLDLQEMVRMSSLQGSLFEIVPTSDEIAVVGAAVSADRARYAL